ncbi:MAG: CocE/NonD family hydrolase C-terminal non-catalytic domain-containing protein, partial [Actinomycetota bacterium]
RVTFTSEPFAEDTLFLGLPQLQLNAAVTGNQITHLTSTLYRERVTVNEEGAEVVEREPMNYCAIQPQLRDGIETVAPVIPGEEMALPMQCFTMAHRVPAGQRLALEISTGTPHHASYGVQSEVTVFTGPEKTRYDLPIVEGAQLWEDVPLLESYPVDPPPGPAQQGVEESVLTPAPGLGNDVEPITSSGLEFDVEEGFDNAQIKLTGTPAAPGDIDIFLQFETETGWVEVASAASDPTAVDDPAQLADHPAQYTETIEIGRVPTGHWRLLVHNWGGGPNSVDVSVEFFNRNGESGGFGGETEPSEGLLLTHESAGYLPQP